MRNKANCPECPKMGAGRKAGNGTWRSQGCQTNPIAKGYPSIPLFHHSSIPGPRLLYKQSQLGGQLQEYRVCSARPTDNLSVLGIGVRSTPYVPVAGRPNEANSGEFQVGGWKCQGNRAQRHPPGPSRLRVGAFRTKRSQFGTRAGTRLPNAICGARGPERSALTKGQSCETKPISGVRPPAAAQPRAATSAFELHASRRNALRRHYEHACAAPNEANRQAGKIPPPARPRGDRANEANSRGATMRQ